SDPLQCPPSTQALGVDVDVAAAGVFPHYDRTVGAVRRDGGKGLIGGCSTDCHSIGLPLRRPCGAHALGVNDVVCAAPEVLPRNDRAPRAVGCDRDGGAIAGGDAERSSVVPPQPLPPRAHALGVNGIVGTAPEVLPRNDRAPCVIGGNSG